MKGQIAGLLATAVLLGATGAGAQGHGAQLTPDEKQILVSKDVGLERWAIALDSQRGTVSGNIFYPTGDNPGFVWCEVVDAIPAPDAHNTRFFFDCYGAGSCPKTGCGPGRWSLLGRRIEIRGSFFLP